MLESEPGEGHTRVLVRNRIRLLNQVNLKPNEELDLLRLPRDRNHRQQIHKWLPASPIVDERDLRLAPQIDHILQVQHRVIVNILPSNTRLDIAVRGLQETAVATENHVLGIPSQTLEVV